MNQGNRNETFCGKVWGKNRQLQVQGGGYAKFNVRPPINNDAMETVVEYMWVDIWCVLYWIIELCHKTTEMHISLEGIAQLGSE